ncbi:carbohydrate porin [Sphingomonas oleivorans]|uniref:Carbohydrate porin n=2 Tax=Sphingomonas oleivorans TaxID=1735121 RepID=A0A2T5G359_9SPHN|nr:carbohydrate porin [Sphingomonas oleivorans]
MDQPEPASVEPQETERPVALQLGYAADIWSVAHGGLDRRTRYLDNLDLTISADLERLGGPSGTRLFAYMLYNNGVRFSDGGVGDAQVVSNIETGVRALRLYEAWVEHETGSISARFGLYDLNSEFDALEASTFFLGSEHGIGTDIAQTGHNGPSIFPSTSLALRLQARLEDGFVVRGAVLDGVPGDPDHPRRTAIRLGQNDGALLVGEIDRTFGDLRLLAGYWAYTARFEDQSAPQVAGAPVLRRGNRGFYLRGEARLAQRASVGRLDGFVRFGKAASRFNRFDGFVSFGLVLSGPFPRHPEDQLGAALAVARTSSNYRALAASQDVMPRRHETALELSYRHLFSKHFSVQPDIQYILNPGLRSGSNALAVGLRLEFLLRR